jgi:hypothetical protein
VAILASACGLRFSDDFEGTELFKSLTLEGERVTGAELQLLLVLNPSYPVPLRIACFYEDGDQLTDDQLKLSFEERATQISDVILGPALGRRPDDEVEPLEMTVRFRVPEPGDYFVACLTPAAPDNGLGLSFAITDPEPASNR